MNNLIPNDYKGYVIQFTLREDGWMDLAIMDSKISPEYQFPNFKTDQAYKLLYDQLRIKYEKAEVKT